MEHMQRVLADCGGNISQSAKLLECIGGRCKGSYRRTRRGIRSWPDLALSVMEPVAHLNVDLPWIGVVVPQM